jgi:arginyl-tRNA synthetase
MKSVIDILEERISAAMAEVAGRQAPAIVRPATDTKFGDYQVNGVMALAKELKTNPKKLAEKVAEKLDISDICEEPEIAGPGFINLRLKPGFVTANLLQINKDADRLGIEKADESKTIVVDFSGPNIAKQMHVGHLRSTIIGDCICRLLELEGHKVIRQNHIGDWGLQMGIVVMKMHETIGAYGIGQAEIDLESLEHYYKKGLLEEKNDPQAAKLNRDMTVKLQDAVTKSKNKIKLNDDEKKVFHLWHQARDMTLKACFEIDDLLGGIFTWGDICGESFYYDKLAHIVEDLKKQKLAKESDGAICIFPDGFKDKEGRPLPVIIQKSDGAYLYATTDLAALRYRVTGIEYEGEKYKADKIIYVTDARQSLHFQMVFAVAEMAGWAKNTELVHVTFGSVLGEDGKPLKTREGENIKLKDLLDEAVERAKAIVKEKNPNLSDDEKDKIAKAVGIGAVKYADFSNNRTSDYVFSFDKMLAMEGNTAPYMQYAYARVQSIKDKGKERGIDVDKEMARLKAFSLTESSELDLAKHLIRYGEAIEAAVADYRPNYLTSYLYELAQKFSVFYTNCPVLDAGHDKRPTRLLLCDLTAKTIKHGLSELLGIEVVKQM